MLSAPGSPRSTRLILSSLALLWLLLLAGFSLIDKGHSLELRSPWFWHHLLWCLLPWMYLVCRGLLGFPMPRFGWLPDLGFALYSCGEAFAALSASVPSVALQALPEVLAPVGIAYAVHAWLRDGGLDIEVRRRQLGRGVLVAFGLFLLSSLGLWIHGAVLPVVAARSDLRTLMMIRNGWPLGHSNYTAAVALGALLWVWSEWGTGGRGWRRFSLLVAALAFVCLLSTGSRAGLLALAVGAAAGGLAWVWRRGPVLRLVGLGLGLGFCLLAALVILRPDALSVFGLGRSREEFGQSDQQRLAMFDTGVALVRAHPLSGVGPGLVGRLYLSEHPDRVGAADSVVQLHNSPLQVAAEAGLPALAGLLLVVAVLLWRRAEPALVPALAALLVYSLLDYQMDVPLLAALAGLLAALSLAGRGDEPAPAGLRAELALLALLLGWGVLAQRPLRARQAFASAMEAMDAGQVGEFTHQCARARELDPREVLYPLVQGMILADPEAHGFPRGALAPDPSQARRLLEESLAVDPRQEAAWFNLGWLLLGSDPAGAEQAFRAAARLSPSRGLVHNGLGFALLALNRREEALAAFARELANNPSFSSSPIWDEPPLAPFQAGILLRARRLLDRAAVLAGAEGRASEARSAAYASALLAWVQGEGPAPLSLAKPAQLERLRWALEQPSRLLLLRPGMVPRTTVVVRYQRLGLGMALRNLDAPVIQDLCLSRENQVVRDRLFALYPAKGHLSASLLEAAAATP
jgi:tetratricopeptide (TPR) repeat protein